MSNLSHPNNLSIGQRGEKAAANYLKKIDYKILEINYTNKTGRRLGEIDIIASDKGEIVFVEVKTREKNSYSNSLPEENITASKLYKLNKIASFYLASKKLHSDNYRFDAISIICDSCNCVADIRHLKNIFI